MTDQRETVDELRRSRSGPPSAWATTLAQLEPGTWTAIKTCSVANTAANFAQRMKIRHRGYEFASRMRAKGEYVVWARPKETDGEPS